MARSSTQQRRTARPASTPLLSSHDFERHLLAKAAEVAPSDVTALVVRAGEIHADATAERASHPALAHQVRLALHLLSDHARGACPQIPYHTVTLLTAALHYYLEPFDVIPDFIPKFGKADDTHVFEIAWRLGKAGIDRYVTWKGVAVPDALPASPAIAVPPPKHARGSIPRARARAAVRPKGRKRR